MMKYTILLFASISLSPAFAEQVRNPFLLDSPWAQSHRTAGMQASTPYRGIEPDKPTAAEIKRFKQDIGKNLGPSPWLVLSSTKYKDSSTARTLWGASLKGVFKYKVDGRNFSYVDDVPLQGITSLSWNLVGITGPEGDRIIVPQPSTFGESKFLVLQDGNRTDSKIRMVKEFVLDKDVLSKACNPPRGWKLGYSGTTIVPLPTGQLAFKVVFKPRLRRNAGQQEFVAIADNGLNNVLSCSFIDDNPITNQVSYEPIGNRQVDMFYASEGGIVKLRFNGNDNSIARLWKKNIPYRNRTGTTPTMVGYGKDKFIVTVDGRCAVDGSRPALSILTGKIDCSEDQSPSKLYAVRRDTADSKVYSLNLPNYISTIENSPTANKNVVVITNYAGYRPDSKERGVVAATWDEGAQTWKILWDNADVQISGVPTISTTSNLVYGTGTEKQDDKTIYLHGLRLLPKKGSKGGAVIVKQRVGPANAAWDPGNNLIINDDQSMMYSTPVGLARIYHP